MGWFSRKKAEDKPKEEKDVKKSKMFGDPLIIVE